MANHSSSRFCLLLYSSDPEKSFLGGRIPLLTGQNSLFTDRKSLLAEPLPSKSRTESFSDDFTTDDPSSGGST
ncbi:hypothetical protein PIB30_115202, partial [Stylosanthes scabra]|nr:hypothetical protein [Stylosanthes scabra]